MSTHDLYVWKAPRDITVERAAELASAWEEAGADHGSTPFEPSTDVGWFYRELLKDFADIDATSDVPPNRSRMPIVLSGDDEPPARAVAIRLSRGQESSQFDSIYGLAAKYDLVLFDAHRETLHEPLREMAAYASATFWPRGAIRAAVVGGAGGAVGIAVWSLGIPLISGVVFVAGEFMLVMAVWSFIHEGRKALASRDAEERRAG